MAQSSFRMGAANFIRIRFGVGMGFAPKRTACGGTTFRDGTTAIPEMADFKEQK